MKQVMERGIADSHCRELIELAMKDGRHWLCCLAGDSETKDQFHTRAVFGSRGRAHPAV